MRLRRHAGWQRIAVAGGAVAARMTVSAQSLHLPDAVDQARNDFASAATAPRLRCAIAPVRPALNYSLQLQTGYVIAVPLDPELVSLT